MKTKMVAYIKRNIKYRFFSEIYLSVQFLPYMEDCQCYCDDHVDLVTQIIKQRSIECNVTKSYNILRLNLYMYSILLVMPRHVCLASRRLVRITMVSI